MIFLWFLTALMALYIIALIHVWQCIKPAAYTQECLDMSRGQWNDIIVAVKFLQTYPCSFFNTFHMCLVFAIYNYACQDQVYKISNKFLIPIISIILIIPIPCPSLSLPACPCLSLSLPVSPFTLLPLTSSLFSTLYLAMYQARCIHSRMFGSPLKVL